jgi:hypothetical protein
MKFQYLHEPASGTITLDHRLTPEVRAMLAAMVSRSPVGGMKQRYAEVVEAAGDEEALTTYPLHPKVQEFFDQFVGKYGHSSIMELTGSPTVGVEGISWFTAWLLFDSPLVAGQEFSTRAVRYKDWPMARECLTGDRKYTPVDLGASGVAHFYLEQPDADLKALHEAWLEAFEAEVAWWQKHLADPANRAALNIGDKEPFRPALDRARWALPGTFATGAAFASNVRERARAIRDAQSVNKTPTPVWADIESAYRAASPGIAKYGLKEAVVGVERNLPGHLASILEPVSGVLDSDGVEVTLRICDWNPVEGVQPYARNQDLSYADPWFNRQVRVRLRIECSLAVARDWHRHRTLYPWHLGVVVTDGEISLDRRYEPKSDLAIERTPKLLRRSRDLYKKFLELGDKERAALALPMGSKVVVSGAGGLRDVLYALELRATAHGANFEYQQQAVSAMWDLERATRLQFVPDVDQYSERSVFEAVGFSPSGKPLYDYLHPRKG